MIADFSRQYHCLQVRSQVLQAIRNFFTAQHYLEVDTPLRCPCVIPESHIDPVTSGTWFLQASPELCMKRLLSKGCDKLFQLCKCFRKNERGRLHLPEFTLLEWYTANATYLDLMDQCQDLLSDIARQLKYNHILPYQGRKIDISDPWPRLTVKDAFSRHADISLETALQTGMFDETLSFQIEPALGNHTPVFLMDYPASQASLAKLLPDNPAYAQRFEFYIAGIEMANGFTELTDPDEQRRRFMSTNHERAAMGSASLPLPEKFLEDLTAMPDAAGIALGVDRLVMFFADVAAIDHVVCFPPEHL